MKKKNQPKLTRKEIEELAKKKGIKLTEDDIQWILNGDPDAIAKLKLTDKEWAELKAKWREDPKLTRK